MNQTQPLPANGLKKLHVKETVLFAVNNIPQADQATLLQFLELINANGSFGSITQEQILAKMRLVLTYIPGASAPSLRILADLLDIPPDRVQ